MTLDIKVLREKTAKLNFFLVLAVAISLPLFPHKVSSLLILALTINWLVQGRFAIHNKLVYFFLAFYFLHAVGAIYSANLRQAFFEIEKKIPFLIFPIVLFNISPTNREYRNIFVGFVTSCFITSLVCLVKATHYYIQTGTSDYFFYFSLTDIIGIHPIYLSMYFCFSCFITIYLGFTGKQIKSRVQKVMIVLLLIYFIVFIFLLSARAEMVAFGMITFTAIALYYRERNQLMRAITLILLLLGFFSGLVYFSPTNRERFKELINYKSQYSIDQQWGGRALRLLNWNCSFSIIKDNFFLGVGPGDTQDELQKCYEERHYSALLFWPDIKYNAHDQYLQTSIDLGVVGLLALLLCFFGYIRQSIKNKNYLFVSFTVLFAVCCLTESMLEVNKGIVFFSFFSSLFGSQMNKPVIKSKIVNS